VKKNVDSLQSLWFPYKCIYPIYEVRIQDDHFPFRDFLVFITENRWGQEIRPRQLTELAIQFPVIHIEEFFFKEKLLPFLSSWSTVRKLILNCIYIQPGLEHLVRECIPRHITSPVLGLWWSDVATGHVPSINDMKNICQTITIQPFRLSLGSQLKDFLPLYDPDDLTQTSLDQETYQYPSTTELQFFSKSPHFRYFNVELISLTFKSLTHLNLVDHNSRFLPIISSSSSQISSLGFHPVRYTISVILIPGSIETMPLTPPVPWRMKISNSSYKISSI